MLKNRLTLGIAVAFVICAEVVSTPRAFQSASSAPIAIDDNDIAGTVTGPSGPEAGVWVIAETRDLPTPFAKIVVTDDRGRYLVPDLPEGSYAVWVRGYGLVDSPKVQTTPGKNLDLKAVPASSPAAAAQYYPAAYWLSLMEMPAKSEFPGTGDNGNGISPNMKTQGDWIRSVKSGGCTQCHALGTKATREIPPALGPFPDTVAAWDRRLKSGQAGAQMSGALNQFGRARVLKMFADWTDRIRAGAVPPAPKRPEGIERNVVITQWDWADPKAYLHDVVSTDRRNPRLNANGPVYGSLELSADYTPVLDPKTNTATRIPLTVRDPNTRPTSPTMLEPSPYWGEEPIWTSKNNVHNPMLDQKGRLWLTSTIRPSANPPECREGSTHPSAKLYPMSAAGRHLAMYDPQTKKLTHIGTCFGTHHLMFAEDANNTLWTSGGGQVIGWFNTRMFDETRDEMKSQGWTALVRDANGNGRRDEYVEPNRPLDPAKDRGRSVRGRAGAGWFDLGHAARLSRRHHQTVAWRQSS